MTILDCCISLKRIQKLVVLGVVDMRQLLLKTVVKTNSKMCFYSDFTKNLSLKWEIWNLSALLFELPNFLGSSCLSIHFPITQFNYPISDLGVPYYCTMMMTQILPLLTAISLPSWLS